MCVRVVCKWTRGGEAIGAFCVATRPHFFCFWLSSASLPDERGGGSSEEGQTDRKRDKDMGPNQALEKNDNDDKTRQDKT